jgi:hypothetical protein
MRFAVLQSRSDKGAIRQSQYERQEFALTEAGCRNNGDRVARTKDQESRFNPLSE